MRGHSLEREKQRVLNCQLVNSQRATATTTTSATGNEINSEATRERQWRDRLSGPLFCSQLTLARPIGVRLILFHERCIGGRGSVRSSVYVSARQHHEGRRLSSSGCHSPWLRRPPSRRRDSAASEATRATTYLARTQATRALETGTNFSCCCCCCCALITSELTYRPLASASANIDSRACALARRNVASQRERERERGREREELQSGQPQGAWRSQAAGKGEKEATNEWKVCIN